MKGVVRKIQIGLTACAVLATAVLSCAHTVLASEPNRVIKVGFFAYPGYHEINDGIKSGYGYDFLSYLKRYTNLNYEFVGYEESWEEMQKMLLDGEIDLVTSARKTTAREAQFDFSEPIGVNNAIISVRLDDERFIPGDYAELNGLTIGLIKGNSRNADLADFAKEKGFTYIAKEYGSSDELETALHNHEVDAISTSSLRKCYDEQTIAEFAPEEFYCIVKKGNTELLREINYGIAQMDVNEGNWRADLFYQNYEAGHSEMLAFSSKEKAYIEAVQKGEKTITVSAQPDADPYSYVEGGKLIGIIPDYFAHLMEMAGLPYTTKIAENRAQFHEWVTSNHTDVVMDFRMGTVMTEIEDFGLLTDSFMNLTTSRVIRKGFTGKVKKIAVVDSWGIIGVEDDFADDPEIIQYPSREDALRAVKMSNADVCYVYTYTAEKFINTDADSNLQSTILKSPEYSEYIYVSPYTDHALCSILNKCIKADASGVLDGYVKQYTTVTYENISFYHYVKLHPEMFFIGVAILLLIMLVVSWSVYKGRLIKVKNERLEHELDQQRKLDESLTFTNFFLDAFMSAYYVNLETKSFEIYKITERLKKTNLNIKDYYNALTEYVERDVHPDDCSLLLSLAHPVKMRQLLAEHEEYSHVYRDLSTGKERMMKLQVIRGADENHAALGFADVTEEMNEQKQRLLGAVPLSPDILNKANIGLWSFELDEGQPPRMYADETMLKLLGVDHPLPPEEIYHAWYDQIDEGSYGLVSEAVDKMMTEHAEVQYPWHHPDGRTMIVRCGGVRNYAYKNGIRIEGTHQDVTETLHYQSEGAKRDKDIIEILASEYTSVYYIDLTTDDLTPYTMNESTESVFGQIFRTGISYSDAYKLYVESLVTEDDKAMMLNAGSIPNILKELAGKKTFLTTYRSDVDGESHYCEMKFVKVGNDENPSAVALGFADKDAVIREEMERKAIADRDAAVIAGLSDDFGCVVYVNYETEEEVHYRFDSLFSANIAGWEQITNFKERIHALSESIMHPDDKDFFLEFAKTKESILEILKKEGAFYHNFRVVIGGETKYYQLKVVLDDKHDKHVIAGFRNVDETVRREMEYQKNLEVANKSKTDFLFNMSHDIRTPMNAIIGFTQLAKKHLDDRERTIDSLSKIEASGNHLLSLINDVLDMSRVEAGKLHSEMKVVDISEAATKLVTICQENAAERDIALYYGSEDIVHPVVEADELHINQIIMNILGNAIKYTKPGGRVLYTIREIPSELPEFGNYVLTIEDNGIGMSEEYLQHIFESFSREETSSASQIQGTGLGMAIVKRLVDYMGGDIVVESKQGVGTKVIITLQMKIAQQKQPSEAAVMEKAAVSLDGKKVLLVEDIDLNREIAVDILEENGMIVDSAVNGQDAVDHVKKRGVSYYDFVLMDIQMPVMNGYQAAAEIRKMEGSDALPIIALSANAFEEDRKKSMEAGMNGHVSKPIMIPELMGALAKFVK